MILNALTTISTIAILTFGQLSSPKLLAYHEISLENRYPTKQVSDVFQDNILLNLAYMEGKVSSKNNINWNEIKKPSHFELTLEPGQVFAFHGDVLDQYKGKMGYTTRAHFNAEEGFKTDGYLYGDGVCHLASLIYWVSKDAGLDSSAPTNHNFMAIPEIPKEYGVSVYNNPYSKGSNAQQNLYVTNNKSKPVTFNFDYVDEKLKVSVTD